MREIKFRAWDKKLSRMFEWNFPTMLDDIIPRTGDLEWMQYTGLHDKNGKEIWEGDITEYEVFSSYGAPVGKTRYEVTFDRGRFRWFDSRDAEFGGVSQPEVIGNIYENPELLK